MSIFDLVVGDIVPIKIGDQVGGDYVGVSLVRVLQLHIVVVIWIFESVF